MNRNKKGHQRIPILFVVALSMLFTQCQKSNYKNPCENSQPRTDHNSISELDSPYFVYKGYDSLIFSNGSDTLHCFGQGAKLVQETYIGSDECGWQLKTIQDGCEVKLKSNKLNFSLRNFDGSTYIIDSPYVYSAINGMMNSQIFRFSFKVHDSLFLHGKWYYNVNELPDENNPSNVAYYSTTYGVLQARFSTGIWWLVK